MLENRIDPELLIKIGGVYHLICATFHIVFPKIYQWKNKLNKLPPDDFQKIWNSLRLMNACQFIFWIMVAVISWFFSHELVSSTMGKSILSMIVFFWIIRIFIFQPIFIGFSTKLSKLQVLFFSFGLILFFIPWINIVLQ